METMPKKLYYATIEFEDGEMETPHFFVFDSPAEGLIAIREYYSGLFRNPATVTMKTVELQDRLILPTDTHVLVPSNDFGIEDDFRDPVKQQEMVESAESFENSLVAILPDEQDEDSLLCRAFYMGPFLPVSTPDDFVRVLQNEPFEISMPLDYVWLYKATGESHSMKA